MRERRKDLTRRRKMRRGNIDSTKWKNNNRAPSNPRENNGDHSNTWVKVSGLQVINATPGFVIES